MRPEQLAVFRLALRASVGVYVVAALIVTYVAGVGPTAGTSVALIATLLLLLVSASHYFTLRFVVLPNVLGNPKSQADAPRNIADSFSGAPGIYGLVASIMTGQGLMVLPFAAISMALFYVLGSYVDEEIGRRATT